MTDRHKKKSQRKRRAEAKEHAARHAVVRVEGRLVPNVIAAETNQQAPNNSYSPPQYYVDREFTCVDCGKNEVWTAKQQQWWYEVAKGPVQSTAIRCRSCRQKLRAARDEQRRRSGAGRLRKTKTRRPG